jgi:hypothetical protein
MEEISARKDEPNMGNRIGRPPEKNKVADNQFGGVLNRSLTPKSGLQVRISWQDLAMKPEDPLD